MTVLGVELTAVNERARHARPHISVLAVIAFVFIGLGWCIAKAIGYTWLAIVWPMAAISEGFSAGFSGTPLAGARKLRKDNAARVAAAQDDSDYRG